MAGEEGRNKSAHKGLSMPCDTAWPSPWMAVIFQMDGASDSPGIFFKLCVPRSYAQVILIDKVMGRA